MKDLISLIAGLALLLVVLFMVHDARAEENALEITQHLYDQAIKEIADGNREFGCQVLRDALLASGDIDDNWETYTSIWGIGTNTCNWINNPSTVETSAIKQ
jgi:type II secretory pathway pseudopilin PulG